MKYGQILISLAFAVIVTSCSKTHAPFTPSNDTSSAEITVQIAPVGLLAKTFKTSTIEMSELSIEISALGETTISDVFQLSGFGQSTIKASYTNLATLKEWTLSAKSIDKNGKVVHEGATVFTIQPDQTEAVYLNLTAQYSMVEASFIKICDSITRCELLVDNIKVADSSFQKQTLIGETVLLGYDYLTASEMGISHNVKLEAHGDFWGHDTLLYSADTTITVISGESTSYTVTLNWVGPNTPPDDLASIEVVLGEVGKTSVKGRINAKK